MSQTLLYFKAQVQVKKAHLNKTPPPVPKSYQCFKEEEDSLVEPEIEGSTEIAKSDNSTLPNAMEASTEIERSTEMAKFDGSTLPNAMESSVTNMVSFSSLPTQQKTLVRKSFRIKIQN